MEKVAFLKVNQSNLDSLMGLSVAEHQDHLIAENAAWLAQASVMEASMSFGIYWEKHPAGLISLIDPRILDSTDDHFQQDYLHVWRVMVDHNFQGRGLGRKALDFAIGYARLLGLLGVTLTTMDKEQGNALNFYHTVGFTPTGRRLDDEIELIYPLR